MIGTRRGRFFYNGNEIHEVVQLMEELTKGRACHLCGEHTAEAALIVTSKEREEQDAPVIPVCGSCMRHPDGVNSFYTRLADELEAKELNHLPFIHVVPALIFRTNKSQDILEAAFKVLETEENDSPIEVAGSRFEIVEDGHQWFYKPDGTASIHYFRDTGHILLIRSNDKLQDEIMYLDIPTGWDDTAEIIQLIMESQHDDIPQSSKDVAEWLKELVWLRLHRSDGAAVQPQDERAGRDVEPYRRPRAVAVLAAWRNGRPWRASLNETIH